MSLIVNPYRHQVATSHTVAKFTAASSHFLSITDAAQSGLGFSSDFAFVAWIKVPGTGSPPWNLFSKWDHPGAKSYRVDAIEGTVSRWFTHLEFSNSNQGSYSQGVSNMGLWDHIAVSYNTSTTVASFWRNGTLYTNSGFSNTDVHVDNAPFQIGATVDGDYFEGSMAFVGAFNATLSSSQVSDIYNGGTPKTYADLTTGDKTNLVSWWNLNETSGNRVDSHGSNDLTDNNSVGTEIWTP